MYRRSAAASASRHTVPVYDIIITASLIMNSLWCDAILQ
jgi:hypothetical protein